MRSRDRAGRGRRAQCRHWPPPQVRGAGQGDVARRRSDPVERVGETRGREVPQGHRQSLRGLRRDRRGHRRQPRLPRGHGRIDAVGARHRRHVPDRVRRPQEGARPHRFHRPGGPGAGNHHDVAVGARGHRRNVRGPRRRRVPGHQPDPARPFLPVGRTGRRGHLGRRPEAVDLRFPRFRSAADGRRLRRARRSRHRRKARSVLAFLQRAAGADQRTVFRVDAGRGRPPPRRRTESVRAQGR